MAQNNVSAHVRVGVCSYCDKDGIEVISAGGLEYLQAHNNESGSVCDGTGQNPESVYYDLGGNTKKLRT